MKSIKALGSIDIRQVN